MAEAAPNSDANGNANANASPADPAGGDLSVSMPESWRAAAGRPTGPTDRVALIENSLRCLTYGWLTLVPVAGAFFVIPAVRMFHRVDRERAEWNPAQHLWLRGLVLASFGFLISVLSWGLLALCFATGAFSFAAGDNSPDVESLAYDGPVLFLVCLLFGSAPTVAGLGYAAARCPNAIGAFVKRRSLLLFSLMVTGYVVLAMVVSLQDWHIRSGPSADWSPYWSLTAWIIWLLGGFVFLALRGVRSWWWLAWLAGAAFLTLWVAAN